MHAISACICVVMPDACCLSMHLCCHVWCIMSQHAFMLSCLVHDVSACIYVVMPDGCCLSMHLCCHAWCVMSQCAFTLPCLMHAVSACICTVMPDACFFSMHLCCHAWCMMSQHAFMLSCLMHDVSMRIYFAMPDAWYVVACIYLSIPDACCLRMHAIITHLPRHVPALTFTSLLHLGKWLFFNWGNFKKWPADLWCSEPWWKFSEFNTF